MLNQEIFNAMTIKLTAYDIPLEVPKFDPKIRRAPKRVVHLEKDEISVKKCFKIYSRRVS